MAKNQIPEWATVGATVYASESGRSVRLTKGTISRVTATSIFVRTNLAAGESAGETRYSMTRWASAPQLWGSNSDYYTRTLISQEDGEAWLAREAEHLAHQRIRNTAARTAGAAERRLNPTTAREAIEALQAYLADVKE